MRLRPRAVSLVLLLVFAGVIAAGPSLASPSSIEPFFGHFVGKAIVEGDDTTTSRDLAVTIQPDGERFRKATMGVLRIAFLSALVLELVATVNTCLSCSS